MTVYTLRTEHKRLQKKVRNVFFDNPRSSEPYPISELLKLSLFGLRVLMTNILYVAIVFLLLAFMMIMIQPEASFENLPGGSASPFAMKNLAKEAISSATMMGGNAGGGSNAPQVNESPSSNIGLLFGYFYNDFYLTWAVLSLLFSFVHFFAFYLFLRLSHQHRMLGSETYVNSLITYFITSYAVGVFLILLLLWATFHEFFDVHTQLILSKFCGLFKLIVIHEALG